MQTKALPTFAEPGGHATLRDQDFRDGINYWHVKDEDLIVVVLASSAEGVWFRRVKQPDEEPRLLSTEGFMQTYGPLSQREELLVQRMENDATLTGDEFEGPWELTICKGCGIENSQEFGHECVDGRRVHGERNTTVTVVRQTLSSSLEA